MYDGKQHISQGIKNFVSEHESLFLWDYYGPRKMEKLNTKPWCPAVVGAKEAAIKFRGATGVPQIQWTLRALLGSPVATTRFLRASKIGASGGEVLT